MTKRKELGKRLASERKRLGHTQAAFAQLCGVGGATQYMYEKGQRSPNADYLLEAIKHGADINFIFMCDGQSTEQLSNIEKLAKLFVSADNESRDEFGKLSDLGVRVDNFKALLKKTLKS